MEFTSADFFVTAMSNMEIALFRISGVFSDWSCIKFSVLRCERKWRLVVNCVADFNIIIIYFFSRCVVLFVGRVEGVGPPR